MLRTPVASSFAGGRSYRRLKTIGTLLLCLSLLVGALPPPSEAGPATPGRSILRTADAPQPQPGIRRSGLIGEAEASASGLLEARPAQPPVDTQAIAYPDGIEPSASAVRPNRLEVAPAAITSESRLQASPEYLQFAQSASGLLPASQSLQIASPTGAAIDFTIAEAIPWLNVAAAGGTANATPFTTQVTVDASHLTSDASPYTGDIVIANQTDPADVRTVHVRLSLNDSYAFATLTSFDAVGNLQRRIKPDGSIIDYEYDSVGRLVVVRYGDGNQLAYAYDGNGNRIRMTDAHGTTVYTYDEANRLTAVTHPGLNPVQYEYDHVGNMTKLTYPDGRIVNYAYDAANRMTSVNDGTGVTSYLYDPTTGYLTGQTLPNGVVTSYTYDADGRLTDVTHRKSDASLLMAFHYTLDANGLRTAVRKDTPFGSETTSYVYDELLRLNQVTYPDGRVVTYTYDALGNRLRMVDSVNGTTDYLYDADNRLLRAGGETFEYDANGNTILRTSPAGTIEYTWDAENRLVGYADGQHLVLFEYDGDGNRVMKTVDGVRTNYVNDVSRPLAQVLATAMADGSVDQQYIYGLERVGLNDGGVSNWRYYLYDSPLRSVRSVLRTTGDIIASAEYDVFGAPVGALESAGQPFAYNGEANDAETGLIFLRARYYNPVLGRFLSSDPFGGYQFSSQSLNPYAYVANDPVNLIDPLGLTWYGDMWDVLGESMWTTATIAENASILYLGAAVLTIPASGTVFGVTIPAAFVLAAGASATMAKILKAGSTLHSMVQVAQGEPTFMPVEVQASETALTFLIDTAVKGPGSGGVGRPPTTYKNAPVFFEIEGLKFLIGEAGDSVIEGISPGGGDLGGVALNKTADLLLSIDDLSGATYDPKTGQIILYGVQDVALPEMNMDDVAVAANSIFSWEDPAISIDPPIVNNQFTVRYEGPIAETEFGYILFEADRVMKTLAMGKDNITFQPVTSSVPGFKTMLQRELETGTCLEGTTSSDRFWFQPKEVTLVQSSDGRSMAFDSVSIELLTEYTREGGIPGQEINPEAEAFAAHFTEHYDEFAAEFPVFQDLKRLAKVVAVVRWIRDNEIPIDLGWLAQYDLAYFDTPETTPATTNQATSGSCTIIIKGGAALTTPNEYLADDPMDPVAAPLAEAAVAGRPAEDQFSWEFQPPAQGLTASSAALATGTQMAVAQYYARSRYDGNLSLSQTDLSYPIEGAFNLELTRFYDSFADASGGFGFGWRELPYSLRFTEGKRTYTFGDDPTPWELYPQLWLAERPAGREDEYELTGASGGLPFYTRAGSEDRLRVQADGTYSLAKIEGTDIAFDAAGRLTSLGDRNGNLIDYLYDVDARLSSIMGPNDRVITLSYDAGGRIAGAAGPGGRVITYTYDAAGNLVAVNDQTGRTVTYTYDAGHRLIGSADAAGNSTLTAGYDIYARVVGGSFGASASFSQEFSLAQAETQVTDPYGGESLRRFDENYRIIEALDSLGNRVQVSYAGDFGPEFITDSHGAVTQIVYDSDGNPIVAFDRTGARSDLWYDGYQRLIATRDPEGIETAFGYDANHNLTKVYHDVHLVLDENGDLVSWSYYPDNVTTFGYGTSGELLTNRDPLGHVTSFGYNTDGQLTAQTPSAGAATSLAYDDRLRLDSVTVAGSAVDFGYDSADNLTQIATAAGDVQFVYDDAARLTGMTDAEDHVTGFAYDADGNLVGVQDAAGESTAYDYDVVGKLTSAALPNGTATAYEYDELGRVAVTYSGQVVAPVAPRVSGGISGSSSPHLTWTHAPQHTRYEVWADPSPYFIPGVSGTLITKVVPPATGEIVSFTDDVAGDSRYYSIVAVNIAGQHSAPSVCTGFFRFTLTPGNEG